MVVRSGWVWQRIGTGTGFTGCRWVEIYRLIKVKKTHTKPSETYNEVSGEKPFISMRTACSCNQNNHLLPCQVCTRTAVDTYQVRTTYACGPLLRIRYDIPGTWNVSP